jgi:uncharacterized membrane protein
VLWLAHHRTFNLIVNADFRLLVLNLVHLGLIALIPFPTEVLGELGESSAAVVFYASILCLTGIAGSLTVVHVLRAGLADPRVPRDVLVHGIFRGLTFAAVFLASIPIALWSPDAAKWTWLLVAILHVALQRRFGSDRPQHVRHP